MKMQVMKMQMKVCRTIAAFRQEKQARGAGIWGLVPTMGYLHAGHLSLVAAARAENDYVAASIFVNPMQFNNPQDLASYPRNESVDLAMLEGAGVNLVFMPAVEEMYPANFQTHVEVEHITQPLEGAHRPGHFRGVATVVSKLFNIIQPQRAYFGQKDAQQVAVIRRMVQDLNLLIEMRVCPTLRESDGLAMSSRNARLSAEARQAASVLYRALQGAEVAYHQGEHHPAALRQKMLDILTTEPLAQVEYVSVADVATLVELEAPHPDDILLSMAVGIGGVRLIDNIVLAKG